MMPMTFWIFREWLAGDWASSWASPVQPSLGWDEEGKSDADADADADAAVLSWCWYEVDADALFRFWRRGSGKTTCTMSTMTEISSNPMSTFATFR